MCLDAGINLIDTADVYSGGLAEDILGEVLRGRRDDVLVATKVRMTMGRGPNDGGLSRHHIITGCEASLRRLGTDHIDLYQVHEWDGQTPLEDFCLRALDLLVQSGKVRYIGASNYAAWQLMKALRHVGAPRPAAVRQPADLLLPPGSRGRVRAGTARGRPGPRHPGVEPAGGRPAVGKYRRGAAASRGLAPLARQQPAGQRAPDQDADTLVERERDQLVLGVARLQRVVDLLADERWQALRSAMPSAFISCQPA